MKRKILCLYVVLIWYPTALGIEPDLDLLELAVDQIVHDLEKTENLLGLVLYSQNLWASLLCWLILIYIFTLS